MSKSSEKKSTQLGMNFSTANGKLRKSLLFELASKLQMTDCFRCDKTIRSIDEFSIEHKEDWLDSNDPYGKFFDLKNIAFSHRLCNVAAGRKPRKKFFTEEDKRKAQNGYQRAFRKRNPDKVKVARRDKYERLGT